MATFSYFLHPPRDDFAATMTDIEQGAWGRHFAWLDGLYAKGAVTLVGATGGRVNTGVAILEAEDEDAALHIVAEDPVTQAGLAQGDLRPFSIGAHPRVN